MEFGLYDMVAWRDRGLLVHDAFEAQVTENVEAAFKKENQFSCNS